MSATGVQDNSVDRALRLRARGSGFDSWPGNVFTQLENFNSYESIKLPTNHIQNKDDKIYFRNE